jgi:hypothetical protein
VDELVALDDGQRVVRDVEFRRGAGERDDVVSPAECLSNERLTGSPRCAEYSDSRTVEASSIVM